MKLKFCIGLFSALVFAACGDDGHSHTPGDGHDHPAGQGGEAGHEHAAATALGEVTVGTYKIKVARGNAIEPGKEAEIDLTFADGVALPGTVRGWIGIESAVGSMKAKFGKEGPSGMHAHLEVPAPLPEGSKLWLEIEAASGTSKGSLALQR
jgi:hypothetical protein